MYFVFHPAKRNLLHGISHGALNIFKEQLEISANNCQHHLNTISSLCKPVSKSDLENQVKLLRKQFLYEPSDSMKIEFEDKRR